MVNLPNWVIPDKLPALYDLESATTIEMVAKLYGSMQTLINEYNEYVANLDKSLTTFETDLLKANDDFKTLMETFVNNFIKCCDIRIDKQDAQIAGAIDEIIKTAQNVTEKAIKDGKVLKDIIARENIEILDRKMSSNLTDVESELQTLKNRMNTFTSLSEGSTTGDAELLDIRNGADGETYATAGEAVRNQLTNVNNHILNYTNKKELFNTYAKFVNGYIENGALKTYFKHRIATDDIICFNRPICVEIENGFMFCVHTFNDGVFFENWDWKTGFYLIPANTPFKCMIARTTEDNTEVVDINDFIRRVTFTSADDFIVNNFHFPNIEWIKGCHIHKETGEQSNYDATSGYDCTDFIALPNGINEQFIHWKCSATGNVASIAFYDEAFDFISSDTAYSTAIDTQIPENAKYIRLSNYRSENANPYVYVNVKISLYELHNYFSIIEREANKIVSCMGKENEEWED